MGELAGLEKPKMNVRSLSPSSAPESADRQFFEQLLSNGTKFELEGWPSEAVSFRKAPLRAAANLRRILERIHNGTMRLRKLPGGDWFAYDGREPLTASR